MKNSARNQFKGRVTEVRAGTTNDEIILDIGDGFEIVAGITQASTERLGLKSGVEAVALIKASWIILSDETEYQFSTRNQFKGEVTKLVEGAVNSEVFLKVSPTIEFVAIITNESARKLNLKEGSKISALFKAPHVILATKK